VITEIRKGKGIENLVGTPRVEEVRSTASVGDIDFAGLFNQYTGLFGKRGSDPFEELEKITAILTPIQINAVLQATIQHEKRQDYSFNTGLFVSHLIQNSYNHGNNGFTLNTKTLKELHDLGRGLEGTPDKPIELTIIGNTGDHCGSNSKYSSINILGNIGDNCGWAAENSRFNITGNTGDSCGERSVYSIYNISGNTGNACGGKVKYARYQITGNTGTHFGYDAKRSTFNITGNTGDMCGGSSNKSVFAITGNTGIRCGWNSFRSNYLIKGNIGEECGFETSKLVFRTPNEQTLQKMLKDVPKKNRVIFIHPDGTEEIIR